MRMISDLFPAGPADRAHHRGARRRARRSPLHADVVVSGPVWATGVVLNASAGGLRAVFEQAVPKGAQVYLHVALRSTTCGQAGQVVWTRYVGDGWLAGIAFAPSAIAGSLEGGGGGDVEAAAGGPAALGSDLILRHASGHRALGLGSRAGGMADARDLKSLAGKPA